MDDPDTIEELRRRLATAEVTVRETATRYDALCESEEWYRTLFETMGQGFCKLQLNLAAFCQRCHMIHDRPEHQRRR
jgi:hypothetical protein